MLSKIISYAPTRQEAINILTDGLDEYVIEGVQHNARLVNAVLRHPSFQMGDTPTSFLPKHIPKFTGVQLLDHEEEELAVCVAFIAQAKEEHLQQPPIILKTKMDKTTKDNSTTSSTVIVRLGGMFSDRAFAVKTTTVNDDDSTSTTPPRTKVTVQRLSSSSSKTTNSTGGEELTVTCEGIERVMTVDNDNNNNRGTTSSVRYDPNGCLARIRLDGIDRAVQVRTVVYLLTTHGFHKAKIQVFYIVGCDILHSKSYSLWRVMFRLRN
jgi:acetyl/propionyl-CoA carboxylase alpha subunit